MKRAVWISLALLIFLPLLAQRGEDFRRRNPLEQVQNMLTEAGVPLSDAQQETLQTIMEEQRRAFREQFRRRRQEGGQEGGGERRRERGGERRGAFGGRGGIGGAMQEKIRGVLTAQQIEVWDNYRNQQIRRRGGFPALRLMLEEVGAPLSSERVELLQTEFREYNQQRRQLRGEGEQADPAKLQELEDQHLSKVIKLLDAEQRRALIQSRREARGRQSD
ncbi:MAG: hypothetical protein O7A06_12220 [Acidobacteria bacterium]|nr:hypothetical protein [Acidobacteriota bacterium]